MKIIEREPYAEATNYLWELRPADEKLSVHRDPWRSTYNECAKSLGFWRPNNNPKSKILGWTEIPKTKEAHIKLGEAMESKGLEVEVHKTWFHYMNFIR
tara:strand:+ start:354 stop:650 length:297 start_codon:yes stop_codon:yes gene_type:complete